MKQYIKALTRVWRYYHHDYNHQSMWLESPITFLHCVHEARMKKIVHLPPPSEKQIYRSGENLADHFAFLLGGIVPFKTILIALSSYHNQALSGLRLSFILKWMPWFEINIICYFFLCRQKWQFTTSWQPPTTWRTMIGARSTLRWWWFHQKFGETLSCRLDSVQRKCCFSKSTNPPSKSSKDIFQALVVQDCHLNDDALKVFGSRVRNCEEKVDFSS